MAGYISGDTRKVTTHRLIEMKQRGEKISMLTSYDYTTAQIVDGAGIDVILVGELEIEFENQIQTEEWIVKRVTELKTQAAENAKAKTVTVYTQ